MIQKFIFLFIIMIFFSNFVLNAFASDTTSPDTSLEPTNEITTPTTLTSLESKGIITNSTNEFPTSEQLESIDKSLQEFQVVDGIVFDDKLKNHIKNFIIAYAKNGTTTIDSMNKSMEGILNSLCYDLRKALKNEYDLFSVTKRGDLSFTNTIILEIKKDGTLIMKHSLYSSPDSSFIFMKNINYQLIIDNIDELEDKFIKKSRVSKNNTLKVNKDSIIITLYGYNEMRYIIEGDLDSVDTFSPDDDYGRLESFFAKYSTKDKLPKTGETSNMLYIGICLIILGIIVILAINKKNVLKLK